MGKRRARHAHRFRPLPVRRKPGADGRGAVRILRRSVIRFEASRSYAMTTIDRQIAYSGTKEVAEALRFDVAALEAYLAERIAGFGGPLAVSQFRGGQSNPTYKLDTPARAYVLRRKPPGKLLPSAHAVDREFRVISALHAQGSPVAR